MAFRFSLQALLRLRRSFEQRERVRLLALAATLNRLRTHLQEIAAEQQGIYRGQQESLAAGTSGAELHLLQSALTQQADMAKAVEEQIRQVEQQFQVQQLAYREAQKNRKILENLRDRQLEIYQRERDRREQQAVDDLFNMGRASRSDRPLLPGG